MTIHRMLTAALPALLGAALALSSPAEAKGARGSRTRVTGQVNLNTASAKELRLLPRMRPQTADAIVAYRTKHPFQSVREVMQVKGVGQASFLRLKPHLAVEGPNTIARQKLAKPAGKTKSKAGKASKHRKATKADKALKTTKRAKAKASKQTKASKGKRAKKAKKATRAKQAKKAKKAKRANSRTASAEKRRAKACKTAERRAVKCELTGRATKACKSAAKKARACERRQAKLAAQAEAPQAKTKAKAEAEAEPEPRAKRTRRPKTAAQKVAACRRVLRTVKKCDEAGRTNPGCVIARSKAKSCAKTAASAPAPAPRPAASKDRAETIAPQGKGSQG